MEEQPQGGQAGAPSARACGALWGPPGLGPVLGSWVGSGGPARCPFPSRGCDGEGARDLRLPCSPEGNSRGRVREAPWRRRGSQGPPSTHLPRGLRQQGPPSLAASLGRSQAPDAWSQWFVEAPGLQVGLVPCTQTHPGPHTPPGGQDAPRISQVGCLGKKGPIPPGRLPGVGDEAWRMKKRKGRGAPGRRGG